MATSGGTCAGCGAPIVPANSFLTEVGELCGQCFPRYQNQQAVRARQAAALDGSLTRRAGWVAAAHAMLWGITVVLTTEAMDLPSAVGGALFVGVLVLGLGLRMRAPWAYSAALVLDGAGTIALILLDVLAFKASRRWIPMFVTPFSLGFGYMLWSLRHAYEPPAKDQISLR